ncbi:DeoR family transcriptional regulator [Salmonella enterica subsp. arizonae]|uniref:DeoR family transcriptional regulator n=1 Tax=Salmonella enterica subsp. arizonae TaxID=59203 RepID=A0A447R3C7_SALER|nr:DeoR family transcriptional regulator [Salmonella enterica subsp. arizonae]
MVFVWFRKETEVKAAIERRMEILEVITRQGKARVENLAERFNVSSVTIRSDLSFLEKNGYIVRFARFGYPERRRNC